MLLRRGLYASAFVAFGLLWACSSCGSPSPSDPIDGGPDRKKPTDAGSDGSDALDEPPGPPLDAGFNPFVGSWVPIPGAPAFCLTRYTTAPEKDISEWKFNACASNRAGCGRFVQDWSTFGRTVMTFPVYEPVVLANGKPMIAYQRVWSNQLGGLAELSIVQELGGRAVLAVGSWLLQQEGDACIARTFVGLAGPAVTHAFDISGKVSVQLAAPPWAAPAPSLPSPIPESLLGGQYFPALARGTTNDAYTMTQAGGSAIPVWHGATNTITLAAGVSSEGPRPVGTMAIAKHFNAPFGLRLVKPDGSWVQIQTPQTNRITNELAIDRANGDDLVWVESEFGSNGPYQSSKLWTSPFATSAAALQPRAVASVTDVIGYGAADMVANRGVVLYRVSDGIARVVRLSDGWGWDFAPEAGDAFMRPLWVDDNEIWMAIADGSKPYDKRDIFGVLKLSRANAGAPTVAPGL